MEEKEVKVEVSEHKTEAVKHKIEAVENKNTEKADKKTGKSDSDKVLFWARVTGGCAVAIFACVLILTMTIMSYTPRINSILANLDDISVELEESSRDVSAIMKSMNEEGLGKMYETLDNIQRIDIDKLNDSIDSLYRIINPLSQIFK